MTPQARRERAAEARRLLSAGVSVREIAERLGVHVTSVYPWVSGDAFKRVLCAECDTPFATWLLDDRVLCVPCRRRARGRRRRERRRRERLHSVALAADAAVLTCDGCGADLLDPAPDGLCGFCGGYERDQAAAA